MDLKSRFNFDAEKDILFIDFSDLEISSLEQVQEIKGIVDGMMKPIGHKVYSIVNYDNCTIDVKIKDEYMQLIKENQEQYSLGTVRYSNKTFTRTSLRLGAVKEKMDSLIYNSKEEAIAMVERLTKENRKSG